MNKNDIFEHFIKLFPNYVPNVLEYKKIGSRCISITFSPDSISKNLLFLYNNDEDWTLGTKIWREKPNNKGGSNVNIEPR